jgi:hypothetical protein
MKSSLRMLSGALLVATIGASVFDGTNEAAADGWMANEGMRQKRPIILVGANGHDTVRGLMPLPLWPPVTFAQGRDAMSLSFPWTSVARCSSSPSAFTLLDVPPSTCPFAFNMAMASKQSVDFCGYWQHHVKDKHKNFP